MKRCVSKCSGIKEEACKEPCSFVNKKYCRLSTQYKMGPYPGCEVTKKESTVKSKKRTVAKELSSDHDIKNAFLKQIRDVPGFKEKAKELKKTLAPFPPDTLIHDLDDQVKKDIHSLIQMEDDSPLSSPHSKENISAYKNMLSHLSPMKLKTRATLKKKIVTTLTKPVRGVNMNSEIEKKEPKTNPVTKRSITKKITISAQKTNRLSRPYSLKKSHPEEFAAKTIQTFMKKTEERRKALFYGTICTDSGVCIALGEEKKQLFDFFKFNTFEYVKDPYKTIGNPSANGFVKELKYEREGYIAYAVLKSSLKPSSDNLAYEYLVGKYLNDVSKRLPTFIETYGLYHYQNTGNRDTMKKNDKMNRRLLPLDPNDIKNVCVKAANLCVLSQHLKNAQSFYTHYQLDDYIVNESAYTLYQIYFALHQIKKEFTHYDLHLGNVLLYEPIEGKYIQYHYHSKNKTVSYKSRYLVKIIDYGRSFFTGSPAYYQKVCDEAKCQPLNGLKKGFVNFHLPGPAGVGRAADRVYGHANALFKNESHDLKFLYNCNYMLTKDFPEKQKLLDADYMKILQDTIYMKEISHFSRGGTIENLTHSDKIHNVTDACERWEAYIENPIRIQKNEKAYEGYSSLGDLHIYTDGRELRFIQADDFIG